MKRDREVSPKGKAGPKSRSADNSLWQKLFPRYDKRSRLSQIEKQTLKDIVGGHEEPIKRLEDQLSNGRKRYVRYARITTVVRRGTIVFCAAFFIWGCVVTTTAPGAFRLLWATKMLTLVAAVALISFVVTEISRRWLADTKMYQSYKEVNVICLLLTAMDAAKIAAEDASPTNRDKLTSFLSRSADAISSTFGPVTPAARARREAHQHVADQAARAILSMLDDAVVGDPETLQIISADLARAILRISARRVDQISGLARSGDQPDVGIQARPQGSGWSGRQRVTAAVIAGVFLLLSALVQGVFASKGGR